MIQAANPYYYSTFSPTSASPYRSGGSSGAIPTDIDYRKLDAEQRFQTSGLNDRERAVLHLWGIQMTSRGFQDGGIYFNVLKDPSKFKPAEVALAKQLYTQDAYRFGGVTGRSLDEEFFKLSQKITGGQANFYQRYGNAPLHYARGPVSMDTRALENDGISNLDGYEKAILRFWGHEPLLNGGKIEGKILGYTLNSDVSLDNDVSKYYAQVLLKADLMADGRVNGDSITGGFRDVLDKLYYGVDNASPQKTWATAQQKAYMNRLSPAQVIQATTQGYQQALKQGATFMKNHPIITGVTAGGILAATAICPYLAGLSAGAVGIAAGQNWMQQRSSVR